MPRTSEYVKEKVSTLFKMGKCQKEIVDALEAEGIQISRQTVGALTQRLKVTGSVAYKKATGWPPTLTGEHVNFIEAQMRLNDELTSTGKYCKITNISCFANFSWWYTCVSYIILMIFLCARFTTTAVWYLFHQVLHNYNKARAEESWLGGYKT